jgi:hypothetical protein
MSRRRRRRSSSLSSRDLRALFGLAVFLVFLFVFAQYWFIFLIVGVGFILIKYSKKSNTIVSKSSNGKTALDKGIIGETVVEKILSKYASSIDSKIFNDIIIGDFGKSTQIDHLLVTENAIYFIETKRYGGGVFGDDSKELWYQVIFKNANQSNKKVKNSFLNPFLQNAHHIKRFKEEIGLADLPPLINIVCFVFNEGMSKDLEIINRTKDYYLTTNETLITTIQSIDSHLKPEKSSTFAMDELKTRIESIIARLNEIIVTDEEERQNHIKRLKLKEIEMLEELSG